MRLPVLILCLLCGAALAAAPQPPPVVAKSWIVADLSSGQVLASHRPDERFEPASLTKLMTAYLAVRRAARPEATSGQGVNGVGARLAHAGLEDVHRAAPAGERRRV